MFVALAHLPAVTVNLLWSFSSILVALLGVIWLAEKPKSTQWIGIILASLGAVLYFHPLAFGAYPIAGLLAALCGILTNAVSSVLGREINRSKLASPLLVTVISMGAGASILLISALLIEGLPTLDGRSWIILLWLALINTAFAFTLWNHTLRTLSAVESSIINGTMIIWIPILAVGFLGEHLSNQQLVGLAAVATGTLMVQLRQSRQPADINKASHDR
jgi:drug/metabolite transporter (DMT)-like permease